jgi:hypothetical protein
MLSWTSIVNKNLFLPASVDCLCGKLCQIVYKDIVIIIAENEGIDKFARRIE